MCRQRRLIGLLTVLTVIGGTLAMASTASASFHLMKVRAIFEGPSGGGFVELQMTADGQNHVGGHKLCIWPNTGIVCDAFTFPADVQFGQNQRTVLIADNAALSPDLPTAGALHTDLSNLASAGAVCWENVDCVSWGSFSNPNVPSPTGTPLSGLSPSQVAIRGIGRGCPTALDEADDTNDSAADFSFGVFSGVRDNAIPPTETLCATPAGPVATKKKCKKHKKKTGAYSAKKKKCKKHKKH